MSLEERRNRGDMIEVFKTLKGFNRVDKRDWFLMAESGEMRATRASVTITDGRVERNECKIYKPPARCEIRNNFFTVRVVRPWNDLPETLKSQKTINGFKTAYDKWAKTKSIEGRRAIQRNEQMMPQ